MTFRPKNAPATQAQSSAALWRSLENDPLMLLSAMRPILGNPSVDSIRRWVRAGKIKSVRVGGRLMCRRSAVLAFIKDTGYGQQEKEEWPERAVAVPVSTESS
ncbi:MAG: helix-turn-helix domain-containing protein [Acidobacteriia bacterium]|nr:helix-turn-helix domain-containing protein [Terriglobia bacterium]